MLYIHIYTTNNTPDSKVHGANMRPIWGRQDPGGLHVGPMNFATGTWSDKCSICLFIKHFYNITYLETSANMSIKQAINIFWK